MENNAETTPDYGLLKLLDRVIVMMMVAILLVLTLPVMQTASASKSAQAMPQIHSAAPPSQKSINPVMFS